jgi:hypothetical protein
VQVKVDIPTNTWTVASTQVVESPPSPVTNETVKVVTTTVQTFNPITEPTPVVETITKIERKFEPVTKVEDKVITDVNDPDFDWNTWWENWLLDWQFFGDWYLSLFDWSNL